MKISIPTNTTVQSAIYGTRKTKNSQSANQIQNKVSNETVSLLRRFESPQQPKFWKKGNTESPHFLKKYLAASKEVHDVNFNSFIYLSIYRSSPARLIRLTLAAVDGTFVSKWRVSKIKFCILSRIKWIFLIVRKIAVQN